MDNKTARAQKMSWWAKDGAWLFRLAVSLALLGVTHSAAAQSSAGPITSSESRSDQASDIRVHVNLVDTPAIVRDSKGNLVLDLTQANFRILDNGVVQNVEGFDMGGAPISLAIVIETSSRVESLLPDIQRTGVLFTQTVLGQEGEAAVIGFDDDINTLSDFTKDHDVIDKTFTHLTEGTGGARLYDALEDAVQMLRERPDSRRRVLITMAEALDTGSEQKLGQVLREAELANITIYSIGLSTMTANLRGRDHAVDQTQITPPGTFSAPPLPGTIQTPASDDRRTGLNGGNIDLTQLSAWVVQHASEVVRKQPLEIASTATGGLYQATSFHDPSLGPRISQISGELHAQYTLSYRPTNTGPGDYHQIKVEVVGRGGVKVRSRPGYYLAAPQPQPQG